MSTLKTNRTKLAMLVGLVAVVGVVGYLASTKDTPTSTEAAGTVMPAERFAAGELQPSVSLDQGGVGVSPEAVPQQCGALQSFGCHDLDVWVLYAQAIAGSDGTG